MADGVFKGTATKVDTHLENNNRLIFEFPPEDPAMAPVSRECPFFENPKITENQSANLVKYDVLGRGGNFFGYTGAKSRSYTVEFNLTLPHIMRTANVEMMSAAPPLSKMDKRRAFFETKKGELENPPKTSVYEKKLKELMTEINDGMPPDIAIRAVAVEQDPLPGVGPDLPPRVVELISSESLYSSEYDLAKELGGYQKSFIHYQAVQMLLFWIDLIRVSVLNNALRPTLGPPIIRLKFGSLYDYISCIATKYNLSWDERAGFDVVTLLPNSIKVVLSLVQVQRNAGQGRTDVPYHLRGAMRNRHNEVIAGWEGFQDAQSWDAWLAEAAPVFGKLSTTAAERFGSDFKFTLT